MRQIEMVGPIRRGWRSRAATLLASALFHVLLFVIVFSRAAGALVSAGGQVGGSAGPVFAVSLVRVPAHAQAEEPSEAAQLRPLLVKVRAASQGLALPSETDDMHLKALSDRLSVPTKANPAGRRAQTEEVRPQGAPSPDDQHTAKFLSHKVPADRDTDGLMIDAVSSGTLWGAIEPCWRKLGFRGQTPVTIQIDLNAAGRLRGPPRVLRGASALLTERRLRSESNALAALAACMPRGKLGLRNASFTLEFPATP